MQTNQTKNLSFVVLVQYYKDFGKTKTQRRVIINPQETVLQAKMIIDKNLSIMEASKMQLLHLGAVLSDSSPIKNCFKYESNYILEVQKIPLSKVKGLQLTDQPDLYGIDEEFVKMPCGHSIGRDAMVELVFSTVNSNGFEIQCPFKTLLIKQCKKVWQFDLCSQVGVFTYQEFLAFQQKLSINMVKRQTKQCPFCQARLIQNPKLKQKQLVCGKCRKRFCLKCNQKWNSQTNNHCGNDGCRDYDLVNKQLASCQTKQFSLYVKYMQEGQEKSKKQNYQIPSMRACPQCQHVVIHKQACKHMICPNEKCKTNFCMVCLAQKPNGIWPCKGAFDYCGKIAPRQVLAEK